MKLVQFVIQLDHSRLVRSANLSLLLLLTLPAAIQAQFNYTVDTNGSVTITRYTGPSGAVDIPSSIYGFTVTTIGQDVFFGKTTVTSISIPIGVTNIGFRALAGCANLNAIMVDTTNSAFSSVDGVLFNKSQTFLIQCPGRKAGSYTVPNSVTSIGTYGFYGCKLLSGISIPNNVVSIGSQAFLACWGLTSVTIPDSVTTIEDNAFGNCNSLTNVTILNSVIGNYEFNGCPALRSVLLANGITNIGIYAFAYCPNLASLTIPNSLTNIGAFAFQYCYSLTNVMIGSGLLNVGNGAFSSCTNLATIFFQGNAPHLDPIPFNGVPAVVFYLPGTTGWSFQLGGRLAVLWNPQMRASAVRTGQFGFTITGTAEIPMVIEACTSPANSTWVPLRTCALTNGSIYFSDQQWTTYPARIYRVRSP